MRTRPVLHENEAARGQNSWGRGHRFWPRGRTGLEDLTSLIRSVHYHFIKPKKMDKSGNGKWQSWSHSCVCLLRENSECASVAVAYQMIVNHYEIWNVRSLFRSDLDQLVRKFNPLLFCLVFWCLEALPSRRNSLPRPRTVVSWPRSRVMCLGLGSASRHLKF